MFIHARQRVTSVCIPYRRAPHSVVCALWPTRLHTAHRGSSGVTVIRVSCERHLKTTLSTDSRLRVSATSESETPSHTPSPTSFLCRTWASTQIQNTAVTVQKCATAQSCSRTALSTDCLGASMAHVHTILQGARPQRCALLLRCQTRGRLDWHLCPSSLSCVTSSYSLVCRAPRQKKPRPSPAIRTPRRPEMYNPLRTMATTEVVRCSVPQLDTQALPAST